LQLMFSMAKMSSPWAAAVIIISSALLVIAEMEDIGPRTITNLASQPVYLGQLYSAYQDKLLDGHNLYNENSLAILSDKKFIEYNRPRINLPIWT